MKLHYFCSFHLVTCQETFTNCMQVKIHNPESIHVLPILEDSRFCYHEAKSFWSISRDAVTMHPKIMEA